MLLMMMRLLWKMCYPLHLFLNLLQIYNDKGTIATTTSSSVAMKEILTQRLNVTSASHSTKVFVPQNTLFLMFFFLLT